MRDGCGNNTWSCWVWGGADSGWCKMRLEAGVTNEATFGMAA